MSDQRKFMCHYGINAAFDRTCRFVNRIGKHPELRSDPDFVEFLEKDEELPKSTSTSALSGAGVLRLFNKVGDSIGKIAFHMDETDEVRAALLSGLFL